jgi:hypothetical protein
MRGLDFSSWEGMLSTLLGFTLVTFLMVAIRLMVMQRVQQRRERENRQINERLKTLIAAYKVLGGSFTGTLTVDPTHLRELNRNQASTLPDPDTVPETSGHIHSSDRSRRIRDAVEGALSDLILLGTEEQVRLAAAAARDLVAGKVVPTHELVSSLRGFIREVLDLDRVPDELDIPNQGPSRTLGGPGGGKGKGDGESGNKGDKEEGAGGLAMGAGLGFARNTDQADGIENI